MIPAPEPVTIIPSKTMEEEEEVSTISTSVNSGSKSGANHMQVTVKDSSRTAISTSY